MKAYLAWIATFAMVAFSPTANADWFTDKVGLNISLAKQVQSVIAPPLTHKVEATNVVPTPAQLPTITVVTDSERTNLLNRIDAVRTSASQNAAHNSRIAFGIVIAALILGIGASIAGFCKAALIAGILSILSTAAVGANNVLPFRDDANSYNVVSSEAHALSLKASLDLQMTPEHYATIVNILLVLAKRGDNKTVAGSPEQMDDLMSEIHVPNTAPAEGGAIK